MRLAVRGVPRGVLRTHSAWRVMGSLFDVRVNLGALFFSDHKTDCGKNPPAAYFH